jgi:hypothetical protein
VRAAAGRSNFLPVAATVGCAALLLAVQLLVPPLVGLANNGDFERVMGNAGLRYRESRFDDKYYAHVVRRFDVVQPDWSGGGYLSSETLLVLVARGMSSVMSPGRSFEIRAVGALHIVPAGLARS